MASTSSAAAVARIVAQSSRSIIHVESSDASSSPFAPHLASLSQYSALDTLTLPASADPGTDAVREAKKLRKEQGQGALLSLLIVADQFVLTRLVPHLPQLCTLPVVLHVATSADHSDVLALRSSGLVVLYSSTPQQARDHAVLAAHLAATHSLGVLHFFDHTQPVTARPIEPVPEADLKRLLGAATTSAGLNGSAVNGHSHASTSASAATGHDDVSALVAKAYRTVSSILDRKVAPFTLHSGSSASDVAVVLGSGAEQLASSDTSVVSINLLRPLLADQLFELIPQAKRIAVLEASQRRTTKLGPVFVDVAGAFQRAAIDDGRAMPERLVGGLLGDVSKDVAAAVESLASLFASDKRGTSLTVGSPRAFSRAPVNIAPIATPRHEDAYNVMLQQVFKERLSVINSPASDSHPHPSARSPEYAFGQVLAQLESSQELKRAAQAALRAGGISPALHEALTAWTSAKDDAARERIAPKLAQLLAADSTATLDGVRSHAAHLAPRSRWIVGSDAWAYDAGMSGVHHVIASGKNVNMLIFDSLPYTQRDAVEAHKRKKDVGLYAMNYGNTYVASTAVYSDYTQVLHALMEADKFDGPSVVLAYIPYRTEDAPALEVLRETKLAVDSGYWPLYRWDPSAEARGSDVFRLDGVRVREQLKAFLDRQSHLSNLANVQPELSYELASSTGSGLRDLQRRKAKEAYDALLGSMDGPPLLILFASDGGNAEKVARKLGTRGKLRGLATRVIAMDDFPISEELQKEQNVVFVTSTAGQGEPPQNARDTFKTLAKLNKGDLTEEQAPRFTVFAMGDSHYWPRPEDARYYNKPGKDLDARLEVLGLDRMAPIGLGDDQDPDGAQTGYRAWEPALWKALGVDTIEVKEAEPEPITNEHIKIASNYLRGTIVEGLKDKSTGALAESDGQLTKFHGTYQQYDRDTFEERKAAGLEPAYSFMIRCRIPGGVCTPEQWLQLDDVATDYGNNTLKITTRQTIQYHCILKSNLKAAMQGINKSLLDTIAACGDVNRNVMCSPNPALSQLHEDTYEFSKSISEYLLPRMDSYHEIWLDADTDSKKKQLLAGGALQDHEPLYGNVYLPRKFKIAIAVPPRNDTDCFAHDIGLIAIADPRTKRLAGFNISVGGGMGVTHSMKVTYPRLGDVLGFVTPDQTLEACKQVMLIQRDTGNRANRKQARLKYTIDNHWKGAENFKRELEKRLGYALGAAREFKFDTNTDVYGWTRDYKGNWHCGLWLENGRVRDAPGDPFRTGLRELAKIHKGRFRMTPNQHIIVADVTPEEKPRIEAHLAKWGMDNWSHSGLKLSASACVAFPTCGLAFAESERYLPILVDKVEKIVEKYGLRDTEIPMRMSGCANGCSRPWITPIGFVGRAPGRYLMLLGGGQNGMRLSKPYMSDVGEEEILATLEPMIRRYSRERLQGEAFGDWLIRADIVKPTTSGREFYDAAYAGDEVQQAAA
ncbi:putative sulfite reductase cys-4 [Ceraceosorus guamensis]|uniref:Sulfite reductase [NADPH] subunit beta n=1 Tax=Ceraceosorus guamensis TaxID=1522189 RepID=A0A316VPK4_9BASI|nr:putative sulfite reductase cys-4 [Ceraceosorus guamensis]PWN39506.1 putative sulfite reductase cys-4 [Ceraceosorus guamensis]